MILRIAIAGEFIGHAAFALSGKQQWIEWITKLTGAGSDMASQILFMIGLLDITVGLIILLKPIRAVILWAALWGFWTALMRPLVGEPIWDFVERWANWGAPLALLYIMGFPTKLKDLLS